MELKNAVAVCLISLFSATLVVLIARSLDSQATSRLEPPLTRIVEELQAIRKQGGMAVSSGAASNAETVADGLIVYYFHSNTRCPTCQSIESQAKEAVHRDFAAQLAGGEMVWKVLNYQEPANAHLAKTFEIQMPVVVLAKMNGGQMERWKRLDEVWALVGDKPEFAKFVRDQIAQMLGPATSESPSEKSTPRGPDIPAPSADSPKGLPAQEPPVIPVPD